MSCSERPCWLVAIAYVLQKTPYVFPIIGGRKVEHLKQNVQALDISLSPEQIQRIENAKPFDVGFPHNFIVCIPIYFHCANLAENVNREIIMDHLRLSANSCCNTIMTVSPCKGS